MGFFAFAARQAYGAGSGPGHDESEVEAGQGQQPAFEEQAIAEAESGDAAARRGQGRAPRAEAGAGQGAQGQKRQPGNGRAETAHCCQGAAGEQRLDDVGVDFRAGHEFLGRAEKRQGVGRSQPVVGAVDVDAKEHHLASQGPDLRIGQGVRGQQPGEAHVGERARRAGEGNGPGDQGGRRVQAGEARGLRIGPPGQGGGKGQARFAFGIQRRGETAHHAVAVEGHIGQAQVGLMAGQGQQVIRGRQAERRFAGFGRDAGGQDRPAFGQFQHEVPVEVPAGVGPDDVHPGDRAQGRLDVHADGHGPDLAQPGQDLGVKRAPEDQGPVGFGGQGLVVEQGHGHARGLVTPAGQDVPQVRGPGVHAFGRFQGGGEKAGHQCGQGQARIEDGLEVHGRRALGEALGSWKCVGGPWIDGRSIPHSAGNVHAKVGFWRGAGRGPAGAGAKKGRCFSRVAVVRGRQGV